MESITFSCHMSQLIATPIFYALKNPKTSGSSLRNDGKGFLQSNIFLQKFCWRPWGSLLHASPVLSPIDTSVLQFNSFSCNCAVLMKAPRAGGLLTHTRRKTLKKGPGGQHFITPNVISFVTPCKVLEPQDKSMWHGKERKIIQNIVGTTFRCNAQGQHTHFARTNICTHYCPSPLTQMLITDK